MPLTLQQFEQGTYEGFIHQHEMIALEAFARASENPSPRIQQQHRTFIRQAIQRYIYAAGAVEDTLKINQEDYTNNCIKRFNLLVQSANLVRELKADWTQEDEQKIAARFENEVKNTEFRDPPQECFDLDSMSILAKTPITQKRIQAELSELMQVNILMHAASKFDSTYNKLVKKPGSLSHTLNAIETALLQPTHFSLKINDTHIEHNINKQRAILRITIGNTTHMRRLVFGQENNAHYTKTINATTASITAQEFETAYQTLPRAAQRILEDRERLHTHPEGKLYGMLLQTREAPIKKSSCISEEKIQQLATAMTLGIPIQLAAAALGISEASLEQYVSESLEEFSKPNNGPGRR